MGRLVEIFIKGNYPDLILAFNGCIVAKAIQRCLGGFHGAYKVRNTAIRPRRRYLNAHRIITMSDWIKQSDGDHVTNAEHLY